MAVTLAYRLFVARRASQRNSGDKTLRTYLESIQPDALVDIVMAQVATDPRLWERLSSAAVAAGAGIDEQRWRRQIDAAFEIDDFVDYREVESWVAEASNLIRRLAELIDGGQAASVVALAEHAYRCCCDAIGSIDDSDGQLGWIASEIGEVHLAACEAARPDPVGLAQRLVAFELESELDAFHQAAATYDEVLGIAGLVEYRRIIEPLWAAVLAPAGQSRGDHYAVREAIIGIALASGESR